MRRVDIQFLNQGFHRVLFDAVPLPVFVVDEDVNILEYNAAAARLVGDNPQIVIRRRGGEVLHCIHAKETAAGCGRALACGNCVVRQSVQAAWQGWRVSRRWGEMTLGTKRKPVKVRLRVSCQPFTYRRKSFILLTLEGLD
jgi:PAS domain-containing protein